jgi:hypothetical protein
VFFGVPDKMIRKIARLIRPNCNRAIAHPRYCPELPNKIRSGQDEFICQMTESEEMGCRLSSWFQLEVDRMDARGYEFRLNPKPTSVGPRGKPMDDVATNS